MNGKSGESLVLVVPPGTQVIDDETNEVLLIYLKLEKSSIFRRWERWTRKCTL